MAAARSENKRRLDDVEEELRRGKERQDKAEWERQKLKGGVDTLAKSELLVVE